jgi:hypothetical protein
MSFKPSTNANDTRLTLSERTSETDDQRIRDVTPLPPPEHLIRFFPIAGTPEETLIQRTRHALRQTIAKATSWQYSNRRSEKGVHTKGPCTINKDEECQESQSCKGKLASSKAHLETIAKCASVFLPR